MVPGQWSQAPRVVFAKTRTACVTIRRPGGAKGPFDDTTGTYPVTPEAPHFTGSARIQLLSTQAAQQLVAEQQITTTGYLVTVSLDATEVQVDDVVTITGSDDNGDPITVDHDLVVRSLSRGSLAWERDLICTDDLG